MGLLPRRPNPDYPYPCAVTSVIENIYDRRQSNFDKGSCSVNALAIAADISWEEAQSLLASAGRKINKPCSPEKLTSVAGYKFKQVVNERMSLAEFVRLFPRGRYIVHIYNHYFAVINGKCHDYYRHGNFTVIKEAWRVKPARR